MPLILGQVGSGPRDSIQYRIIRTGSRRREVPHCPTQTQRVRPNVDRDLLSGTRAFLTCDWQ